MSDQLNPGGPEGLPTPQGPEIIGQPVEILFYAAREEFLAGKPDASGAVYLEANGRVVSVRRREITDESIKGVGALKGFLLVMKGEYDSEIHSKTRVSYDVTITSPVEPAEHIIIATAAGPTGMMAVVKSETLPPWAETGWAQLANGALARDPSVGSDSILRRRLVGDEARAAIDTAFEDIAQAERTTAWGIIERQQLNLDVACSRIYGKEASGIYVAALRPLFAAIRVTQPEHLIRHEPMWNAWEVSEHDPDAFYKVSRVFIGQGIACTLANPQSLCVLKLHGGIYVSITTTYKRDSLDVRHCEVRFTRAVDFPDRRSQGVGLDLDHRTKLHQDVVRQLAVLLEGLKGPKEEVDNK